MVLLYDRVASLRVVLLLPEMPGPRPRAASRDDEAVGVGVG